MNAILPPAAIKRRDSLQQHLEYLLGKYELGLLPSFQLVECPEEAAPGAIALLPGWKLSDDEGGDLAGETLQPILPWRSERRFVELRNLVTTQTIEGACLWRSRVLSSLERWTLLQAIYREIGLCQWVLGEPVVSVSAKTHTCRAANLVGRLASGIAFGIEINLTLPQNSPLLDRHEIIARRGVASDQVVDSILRPHSLYVMTQEGRRAYRDTDTELFGLTEDQAALVREAFCTARQPHNSAVAQHRQICRVVAAVAQSSKTNQRIDVVP